MDEFWSDSDYFTGPPLDESVVPAIEAELGYKLPASYVALLRRRNGGTPRRTCFPIRAAHAGATDHVTISGLRGIGGRWGIDSPALGSKRMIAEWGYPRVGVVVGECPSAGHDVVMLDYSQCGPQGEPRVIHVETECDEPRILVLADDFAGFQQGLVDAAQLGGSHADDQLQAAAEAPRATKPGEQDPSHAASGSAPEALARPLRDETPDASAIPLCPRCLGPIEPARYYCKRCGHDTGALTTYIPYVDIPWMANGFAVAWHRLWHDRRTRWYGRVGYFLFIALFAPVMLVGLPFVLLARRKRGAS